MTNEPVIAMLGTKLQTKFDPLLAACKTLASMRLDRATRDPSATSPRGPHSASGRSALGAGAALKSKAALPIVARPGRSSVPAQPQRVAAVRSYATTTACSDSWQHRAAGQPYLWGSPTSPHR